MRHKFNAIRTTVDDISFSSKKESEYYRMLKLRQMSGEVLFFLRQVRFDLEAGLRYTVDFMEFHADGNIHFVEVKGMRSKDYIMRKKLVESQYPIKIEEV